MGKCACDGFNDVKQISDLCTYNGHRAAHADTDLSKGSEDKASQSHGMNETWLLFGSHT